MKESELETMRKSFKTVKDRSSKIKNSSSIKRLEKIDITYKEFELIKLLSINRGKVLIRNYLLDKVWGYEYFGETRTVDVHIRHLRKKIEDDDKKPKYIETIRGVGYKMK